MGLIWPWLFLRSRRMAGSCASIGSASDGAAAGSGGCMHTSRLVLQSSSTGLTGMRMLGDSTDGRTRNTTSQLGVLDGAAITARGQDCTLVRLRRAAPVIGGGAGLTAGMFEALEVSCSMHNQSEFSKVARAAGLLLLLLLLQQMLRALCTACASTIRFCLRFDPPFGPCSR